MYAPRLSVKGSKSPGRWKCKLILEFQLGETAIVFALVAVIFIVSMVVKKRQ